MADPIIVTAKYGTVVTAIGKAKIAAAILAGEQVRITHAAVGDGGGAYYYPTDDQIDLINECWFGEIASMTVNKTAANMIDIKFVIPAEVGGFTVREGKIVDQDGDVIAIWNTPDIQKIVVDDGATFPLTMVAHIVVEDANAVTVAVNPALDTVSREELEQALQAYSAGVGSAIIEEIKLPASGWYVHGLTDPGYVDYPYAIDIAQKKCTENHFPVFALHMPYYGAADIMGLCQEADTFDGLIRFYAKRQPQADLVGTLQLRSANLMDNVLGNLATDEEVKDTVEDVFDNDGSSGEAGGNMPEGHTVATDEEVHEEIIQGIFGQ